jgi:hypothetical protein
MAKSTRSKVKRSFRSSKRKSGVYAAAEAARLQRLSAKITAIASKDKQGDILLRDGEVEKMPGWCWYTVFGLLDPGDITPDILEGSMEIGSTVQAYEDSSSGHIHLASEWMSDDH